MRPIPKGEPANFDNFRVVATDTLWTWWRELSAGPPREDNVHDTELELQRWGDRYAELPIPNGQVQLTSVGDPTANSNKGTAETSINVTPGMKKSKRSTQKGDAREKLIAALTKHHQYADGCCLNVDSIGNNELARLAEVSESTASTFFKKQFEGYPKYRALCGDKSRLIAALKLLNQEYSPHHLYGATSPGERQRGDEE